MVNMADESTNFVELKDGSIRYSAYEHFNKLLKRHLRFEFPTYLFADATFEVNDDGDPFWICARLDKTIGLFGGTDVIGIVLVDAVSGECIEYSMDQLKDDPNLQWIDRVYDSDLIVSSITTTASIRRASGTRCSVRRTLSRPPTATTTLQRTTTSGCIRALPPSPPTSR